MLNSIVDFVNAHVALTAVLGGSFLLLIFSAVISALAYSVRVYLGTLSMIVGSGFLLAVFGQVKIGELLAALGICAVFGGGTYTVGYFIALIVRIVREKNAKREERYRLLQYSLPDRENSYVRARLNGVLCAENEKGDFAWSTEFSYAHALLGKVRASQLSPADRLQAEDMGKLLAMYGKKERLATEDLKVVNETFAALLKLAAKYSVNP